MTSSAHTLSRAARIILVGAPGVGKGTQSSRLISRYPQLSAIATGDLVRSAVRAGTKIGREASETMKAGGLIPDASIIALLVAEMKAKHWISGAGPMGRGSMAEAMEHYGENGNGGSGSRNSGVSDDPAASFILDGFPRTDAQARKLDRLVPINFVVSLVTPVEIILERIAGRWVHEASGRVYNTGFNKPKVPGKDDVTGEPLVQREDDSEATWKARLKKFDETSQPLLEHYDKKGLLWTVQGNSSDEISPMLYAEIERRFC